ncbi:MAG: hypothetical protein RR975_12860 [Clostridia bacterium]
MQNGEDFKRRLENGVLTSADVCRLIDWQCSLPDEKMDCALLKECYAYLYDDADQQLMPGQEEGWTQLRQRLAGSNVIPFKPKQGMSRKKLAAVILVAALMLALAAGALAWTIQRGVFNFLGVWTNQETEMPVQEEAYSLLQSELCHVSYAHVDVDVREAVYDGHELRVVYSVWDRSATEMVTEEQLTGLGLPAALTDGLVLCDYFVVNGVCPDLGLTFANVGEKPGEILYYLSSNLAENGELEIGGTLTIGLPIMAGDASSATAQYVPEGMTFTIPAAIDPKLVQGAIVPITQTIGDVSITLEKAIFSPVSAAITLRMDGKETDIGDLAMRWGSAMLYDADGNAVGVTEIRDWDYSSADCIRLNYTVYPPKQWPEKMWMALPGEDGKVDLENALPVQIAK